MNLNWLQGFFLGLVSGFADILPVSAQAHRLMILRMFGVNSDIAALRLVVHLATFAALYVCSSNHLTRITRARALAKIPKRRRKRPLDKNSLMDFSMLKTALIPIVIAYIFYQKTVKLADNVVIIAALLFLNGVILYIPQFLPGSNKHSDSLTPVEGFLFGMGGAISIVPGISAVGTAVSVGSVCGMEKKYALNMALLMNMAVTAALIVHDLIAIGSGAMGAMGFSGIMACVWAGAGAFLGVFFGVKLLRKWIANLDFSYFGIYCWGAALFIFVLYLSAG